jgi:hypothetical protein
MARGIEIEIIVNTTIAIPCYSQIAKATVNDGGAKCFVQ